jgi:hypothetical protein
MISMRCWSLRELFSWRLCDHLVVARDVIMISVVTGLTMIMLVRGRCRFREGIADVVRDRLAGTVISAVAHPTGQLRN